MPRAPNLPIVAIVGRPNVGKSTLFNRYAGKRRALVEDEPGLTRDRIAAEVEVGARRVLVVDTAGLDGEANEGLRGAVQQQARSAIAEADAVLFLVDGKSGLLPEDESLARTLRQTSKPVMLAVNKIDRPQHEPRIGEFYGLGFEHTKGISAEHATGAWDALDELVGLIPERRGVEAVRDEGIRIAIVGAPNVGKSSLLNRLVGEERVVVSDVPGTTRDAVDTLVLRDEQRFTLIDTAGLRKRGKRTRIAEAGSALMTVRALERAQVAFVVLDASQGFRAQDATIASLAQERGCSTAIIANKWDLVVARGAEHVREAREGIQRGLHFLADAPLYTVSAKTGAGVGRLLERAQALQQGAERRIPTAELNRWLQDCVRRHEPAMAQRGGRKRPLKFFYATQTSVRPPTFVLVCTDPGALQPSYRRFLENRLRERFGFAGVPIRLRLRPRSRRNERDSS